MVIISIDVLVMVYGGSMSRHSRDGLRDSINLHARDGLG